MKKLLTASLLIASVTTFVVVLIILSFPAKHITKEVISVKKKKKVKVYAPPVQLDKTKGKASPLIAVVLDDFGYSKKNLAILKKINGPITLAVLPDAPYTKAICSFAKENKMEVILHLPMEPNSEVEPLEKNTIKGNMDDKTVKQIIADAFGSVPSAKGASNHMGSKATGDERLMKIVFSNLKKKDVFFLDSFTTDQSVCAKAAKKLGVPYARRDVFIDNESDKKHIERQLKRVESLALKNGSAIAIGHDRALTIKVLYGIVPEMKKNGIRFVRLSEIIKEKR